jgi:PEP-CTERM motif
MKRKLVVFAMTLLVTAGGIGGMALFGESAAHASTTLLALTDPASQLDTPFALNFTATAAMTTLSVGGYQVQSGELVQRNSVMLSGGGPQLLGMTWTFIPAASGSLAGQGSDFPFGQTGVNELAFDGSTVGSFDTFTQTFATTPGDVYTYAFVYSNAPGIPQFGSPSALLVEISTASAVPEPSTWALTLLGFAGLGFVAYRRRRKPALAAA